MGFGNELIRKIKTQRKFLHSTKGMCEGRVRPADPRVFVGSGLRSKICQKLDRVRVRKILSIDPYDPTLNLIRSKTNYEGLIINVCGNHIEGLGILSQRGPSMARLTWLAYLSNS